MYRLMVTDAAKKLVFWSHYDLLKYLVSIIFFFNHFYYMVIISDILMRKPERFEIYIRRGREVSSHLFEKLRGFVEKEVKIK